MADKKQLEASKIDALYSWISYDLQKMKGELLNEMKYSSVQVGSLYQEMKSDKDKSSQAISQEIRYSYKQNQVIYDGLANMLNAVDGKLGSLDDIQGVISDVKAKLETLENVDADALAATVKEKVSEVIPHLEESLNEIKYGYMQQQSIYDGLTALITGDVVSKLDDVEIKLAALEQIDKALEDINAKIAEGIALYEDNDYKAVIESVAEKTEESVSSHSRKILDAVAAIPVAENVDYNRIVDEVGDKVLELLGEVVTQESEVAADPVPQEPVEAKIDYDKLIYGTAEKVVESLPYPEKVDYRRINDSFANAVEKIQPTVSEETIANAVALAVEKAISAIDIDAIAAAVAEKIEIPVVEPEPIDYDRLADMVAARIAANTAEQVAEVVVDEAGIEKIADKVAEKIQLPVVETQEVDYDRIANLVDYGRIAEVVDYDRIAEIVEDKLANNASEETEEEEEEEEVTYDLVLDEEGIQAIAKGVAEELCQACAECNSACSEEKESEEPVAEETLAEETLAESESEEEVKETEEVAEEPEEAAEEVVEEVTEETVEEVSQETAPETVSEEIAFTEEPAFEEINDQLVDAETGLVIRLKKSFTAKMRQSEERVKGYYSDIRNELTSYKKINANISWHGDRFNFGRDTVAKVNICGKTLCFYLALDPEDPEFKTTVYHQKNVGNQKAYENTPFMVKIKSDAAAKKALRLIGYLAEKLGTEKEEGFESVDYVEQFAYASTKQLFDEGYIKVTKEKKVDLDF